MSRHKLVKTLDFDEELDVYDGADFDDDYDVADESRLREGVFEVRAVLGPSVVVSDKDIEDSLWHYYYDTDKTVNYLLRMHAEVSLDVPALMFVEQQAPSQSRKTAKKNKDFTNGESKGPFLDLNRPQEQLCCGPNFMAHFFADAPWLDIPVERQGEILIEPLYPRRGLLGGSSNQGGPKVSKLAALAAARKKKENEKQSSAEPQQSNSSVALLERLKTKDHSNETKDAKGSTGPTQEGAGHVSLKESSPIRIRKYQTRRRSSHDEASANDVVTAALHCPGVFEDSAETQTSLPLPIASPSIFARTVVGCLREPLVSLVEPVQTLSLPFSQNAYSNTKLDPFAGPSPDDIVTKAQTWSKGAKPAKKTSQLSQEDKATNGIAQGVAEATIDEGPRPKSKNLDVLAEFQKAKAKQAANFVVIGKHSNREKGKIWLLKSAGHVDAGKSTLMGRLLYDLQVVDQRTVDKYRKEAEKIGKSSFALAWVLDQGTEERKRGVTIDIAMNKFETEKTSFTILDAPGHRDFIPNMIAGASQADFAVLVIDASTGSFESGLRGQTKEHALLVRSMGVQRIVVAVNKLDTVQWSKDRFHEIRQQISAFLTTAGFQAKNIAFVPCSGLTGDNIARKVEDSKASWYNGPVLLEALEDSDPANRAVEKPLRLTIADIFRGGVQNPLSISGRLESGSLQIGDKIIAMPANETATVKGIDVDSEPADWAVAGQNVVLHLTDIEQKYLKPGDAICPPSAPIKNITSFTVKILAFDHVTPMHVEVHRGRLHVPGRITQLVAVLDKSTGAEMGKKKPRLVQPGAVARVVVEVETAVPLEAPGRVVLRAGGETVAAGLLE
ncbi:MAG: hypothetical protein LQ338_004684 [Usnochroma carphineum]|nr:MAG: hypothetical protein LQ338_004684 [Usnochroma carphineum]